MQVLNDAIPARTFDVGFREAEVTRFADNSWRAVKVAFANEIDRLRLALDVSATKVHEIVTSNTKLNISPHYLRPVGPFGGSCLPKDVRDKGRDVQFVLLGGGPARAGLKGMAQTLGIADHVTFTGRTPDDVLFSACRRPVSASTLTGSIR